MRRSIAVLSAFLSCSAFAQQTNTICQQIGNMTYCNGQAQQQNSGNANWLQYQKLPNTYDAMQKGREDALRNQMAQQQLDEARAQAQRNQALFDQQMAQAQASKEQPPAPAKPNSPMWNTVAAYRTESRDTDAMTIYLSAAGNAFEFANSALVHDKKQPLYCLPPTLSLNVDNYRTMIDKVIAETSDPSGDKQTPVELALLIAMKQTFPCPTPAPTAATSSHHPRK